MEWRKSLQAFEETPPTQNWLDIQESLDQDVPLIRKQLYDYAEEAPADALSNIFNTLDTPQKRSIFSISRSRAVAAASITVLGLLSVFYLINAPKTNPKIEASVIQSQKTPSTTNLKIEQVKISPKIQSLLTSHSSQKDTLIQHWQKKIAHSPYVPTGNNFFDIAEMVHLIEENEKH